MPVEKEDMKSVGAREEDAEGWGRWRDSICCGGSRRSKSRGRSPDHVQKDEAGCSGVVLYLYGAVDSSGEEASSGDGQSCHAPLMSEQRLCTDHVVHAPHLHNTNTWERQISTILTKK